MWLVEIGRSIRVENYGRGRAGDGRLRLAKFSNNGKGCQDEHRAAHSAAAPAAFIVSVRTQFGHGFEVPCRAKQRHNHD